MSIRESLLPLIEEVFASTTDKENADDEEKEQKKDPPKKKSRMQGFKLGAFLKGGRLDLGK